VDDELIVILENSLLLITLPSQNLPKYSGFLQVHSTPSFALSIPFCLLLLLHSIPCPLLTEPNQELQRQGDLSNSQLSDVSAGIQDFQRALQNINATIKNEELREAHVDLVARVQDRKNLKVSQLGNLLLFDVLNALNSRS
jgi:hypothetical protein